MCNISQKEVIVLGETRTTRQPNAACEWFARVATAVRNVIDETPGGAIVIHRSELPELIVDEDNGVTDFDAMRMRGLPMALRARAGLRTAPYRGNCHEVVVIFDPTRISLARARETDPGQAYAPTVRAALA